MHQNPSFIEDMRTFIVGTLDIAAVCRSFTTEAHRAIFSDELPFNLALAYCNASRCYVKGDPVQALLCRKTYQK
jgi:hypothetical protein